MTIFTPKSLAQRWHCCESTIYNMIERGDLAAFKVGGKLLRITEAVVEAHECQNGGSPDETENSALPGTKSESWESQFDAATDSEQMTPKRRLPAPRLDTPSLHARWARR